MSDTIKNIARNRSRVYVVKAAESRPRDVKVSNVRSSAHAAPTSRDRAAAQAILKQSKSKH